MPYFLLILLLLISFREVISATNSQTEFIPVRTFSKNQLEFTVGRKGSSEETLEIFCYLGEKKGLGNIWRTIFFRVTSNVGSDCELYSGADEHEVKNNYESASVSWFRVMPGPVDSVRIPVFNRSCVGVSAKGQYVVRLDVKRVDYWRISLLAFGLVVFFLSPTLSRNTFMHYVSGVGIGLTASILIIVFCVSRMIPKKTGAVTLLFGGWAVALYIVQLLWSNVQIIFQSYSRYVIIYIVIVGAISFAICYYFGPVANTRALNLIQWTLQICALGTILFSSENQEFSMGLVLASALVYNFPEKWLASFRTYWRRKFPPKIRLLSEEEYREVVNKETELALKQLRNYCHSPECNSWKVVSRLKTPLRFAEFVEGASHLQDEEILEYETSEQFTELNDSDSDEEHIIV